jgi:hypothetical protein
MTRGTREKDVGKAKGKNVRHRNARRNEPTIGKEDEACSFCRLLASRLRYACIEVTRHICLSYTRNRESKRAHMREKREEDDPFIDKNMC